MDEKNFEKVGRAYSAINSIKSGSAYLTSVDTKKIDNDLSAQLGDPEFINELANPLELIKPLYERHLFGSATKLASSLENVEEVRGVLEFLLGKEPGTSRNRFWDYNMETSDYRDPSVNPELGELLTQSVQKLIDSSELKSSDLKYGHEKITSCLVDGYVNANKTEDGQVKFSAVLELANNGHLDAVDNCKDDIAPNTMYGGSLSRENDTEKLCSIVLKKIESKEYSYAIDVLLHSKLSSLSHEIAEFSFKEQVDSFDSSSFDCKSLNGETTLDNAASKMMEAFSNLSSQSKDKYLSALYLEIIEGTGEEQDSDYFSKADKCDALSRHMVKSMCGDDCAQEKRSGLQMLKGTQYTPIQSQLGPESSVTIGGSSEGAALTV